LLPRGDGDETDGKGRGASQGPDGKNLEYGKVRMGLFSDQNGIAISHALVSDDNDRRPLEPAIAELFGKTDRGCVTVVGDGSLGVPANIGALADRGLVFFRPDSTRPTGRPRTGFSRTTDMSGTTT
jgi:hypothetical protein